MSPLMKPALEAGTAGLARKAHPWELTPDKFFTGSDEFRATAAPLLGCSADCIAIVPSASYGIATAARNLPVKKGQTVLVLEEQFPSNYYPWQRLVEENSASLKVVPWPDNHDWTVAVLNFLTADVAIAALPHVQWTSGGRLDLVRIGEACRKIGAALVLDLTQSLGALPFSVAGLQNGVQPDFAVAASYKWLLGPYSVGLLYVAPNGRAEYRWRKTGFSAPMPAISRASSCTRKIMMRARGASTWGSLELRAAAGRRARHEAVAGVGCRADFGDRRSAQPSARKRRRGLGSRLHPRICGLRTTSACEKKRAFRENSPKSSRAKKCLSACAAAPSAWRRTCITRRPMRNG